MNVDRTQPSLESEPPTPQPPKLSAPIGAMLGVKATKTRQATKARQATEAGQATAEYALVMLAAAALAGLLIAWAGGTDGIGRLLDAVMDSLIRDAS